MPAKTTLVPRATALLMAVGVLVVAPFGASAALATQGSVPSVVAAYAADPDGLLARLDDLFGVGATGKGLDFGNDTKVGELDRVFTWTSDFLAGATGAPPIKLTNEWTATITIADKPVGVATVWINPADDAPDLAAFTEGASLGAAFAALPAEASLVHDAAHSAWFTLTGDALVPLVKGDSGVSSTTSPSKYQKRAVADAGTPQAIPAASSQGAINSTIVVVVALLVVAALVILTGRQSRKTADAAAQPPAGKKSVLPPPVPPASPVATVAPAKPARAASRKPTAGTPVSTAVSSPGSPSAAATRTVTSAAKTPKTPKTATTPKPTTKPAPTTPKLPIPPVKSPKPQTKAPTTAAAKRPAGKTAPKKPAAD